MFLHKLKLFAKLPFLITLQMTCKISYASNQSTNQSNFYSANIAGVARLSGATPRSVFKCEVVEAVP